MKLSNLFAQKIFSQSTVFVTGGGSGINLGIARGFAGLGARIAICGRTSERLDRAAAELRALGTRCHPVVADVRDPKAIASALTEVERELGPIEILVCGAAGNFLCRAEELSAHGFASVVEIDLHGSFHTAKAAFSQLQRTSGNIIFISAGQASIPYPAQAHAAAAKAGVEQLMRCLALEWGRFGIRCNAIVPGPTEGTEGMRRLAPGPIAERMAREVPLGRLGSVDELAAAALFLASPLAAYVTGTVLLADGGQSLTGSGVYAKLLETAETDRSKRGD